MHPRELFALGDDRRFEGGEFVEAPHHFLLRGEVHRQPRVGGVVAGLGLEQAAVKRRQFDVLDMIGEGLEPLATAGFDEPGDEQAVDGPLRLLLAAEVVQLAAILARLQAAKRTPRRSSRSITR